ncbi:MAG: amylo-alpha-1,6-glucosidase [Dysgonamonadaceae bacterium]|jgi:predicted glycogen debranching enzyme|nr:amylo-alpha-1,6-glucosidase [Dysgonamonadaceae bacterium]
MGYIKFDKTQLINLEESLPREVLRTNRSGAYHSTTIIDCNTRKYHGLLVLPIPEMGNDNHVILSSLDETVIQHGAEFNLGIHQYDNNTFSPNGHKYIREYIVENIPKTLFRVGGVMMTKEKLFTAFENRILIKYTLTDAHSKTLLRFKPFMAFRNVNMLTKENSEVNKDFSEIENGIKTSMYDGYPDLFMQFSKPVRFIFNPTWYKNIEYSKEKERGYQYKEDLYVPGYFEVEIEKGESIYFSGSDTEIDTNTIPQRFSEEIELRPPRIDFFSCLNNAAQQLYYCPTEEEAYIIAGYPWFKVRARDLFIALPGIMLTTGNISRFERIANTAIKPLKQFMETGKHDDIIKGIETPDTLLWAVWTFQQYHLTTQKKGATDNICNNLIPEIINYICENKHPNLKLDDNGLLYADGHQEPITWMNSTVNGRPAVPRSGYIVEFNLLWYNALKFAAGINKGKHSSATDALAEKTGQAFREKFINQHGYLFDYIDGQYPNWHVRPNMLLATCLEHSPLDNRQQRTVMNIVTRELLTPKGIRSLSPKSEGYKPYNDGTQYQRDLSAHQGAAYPWLLGFYLEGYIKLYGQQGIPFAERMLIGLEDEIKRHCIGTLSELYDGNPPFQSHGAISFAINVAAILRILKLLEVAKNQEPKTNN